MGPSRYDQGDLAGRGAGTTSTNQSEDRSILSEVGRTLYPRHTSPRISHHPLTHPPTHPLAQQNSPDSGILCSFESDERGTPLQSQRSGRPIIRRRTLHEKPPPRQSDDRGKWRLLRQVELMARLISPRFVPRETSRRNGSIPFS